MMGRYMRKAKITREVAATESSLGVRTRARTLAQKTQVSDSGAYLQLRSRRLEKKVAPLREKARKEEALGKKEKKKSCGGDLGVEASFGENVLEIEGGDRSTRETTPCSLIRSSDTIGTPGSTTRPTNSSATNRRIQSGPQRIMPTSQELDEFFAIAEQEQIRIFTEKYNFDPVTETPLPGRFEWEKVDP